MPPPPSMQMFLKIIISLANRLVVLALLIALSFLLPRLMPGDPLDLLVSQDAVRELTAGETARLKTAMGLAGDWPQQFASYLQQLAAGDLDYSMQHASPVATVLAKAFPWTALLIGLSLPIFLVIGVGTGIEAGLHPHGVFDGWLALVMAIAGSLPPFAWAVFLLLALAILWPIFPASGAEPLFPATSRWMRAADILRHAALPAIALAMHEVVRYFFLARGESLARGTRPFVINAIARGVGGWRLRLAYMARNMIAPLSARLAGSITGLVTAVLFVELAFSYPGLGQLIYGAILQRDYALLQGAVLVLSVIVLVVNAAVDMVAISIAARARSWLRHATRQVATFSNLPVRLTGWAPIT